MISVGLFYGVFTTKDTEFFAEGAGLLLVLLLQKQDLKVSY
ncbi:hypothetical protein C8N25_10655 [Algoriphagus antarcticus]|uniref:Uncharacterized protein n=1 Tax=Algoriphagus antarcticus TaxID=238540 RepID=A0A3E0DWT3_9BACT|nr:hypothetical protein C8N25_10655 [Algoriphagus antarcticus]